MTLVLDRPDTVLEPRASEAQELETLSERITEMASHNDKAFLVGPNGARIDIPASAFEALQVIANAMARGQTITLMPQGKELTTQQAADLLHVSRPHLIELLNRGVIPHHRVGTHRRINIEDVLEFRRNRRVDRRQKLAELSRLSEELPGGYS
jgi:excisionase family DNA binding protein